jgi:hypothetical protein
MQFLLVKQKTGPTRYTTRALSIANIMHFYPEHEGTTFRFMNGETMRTEIDFESAAAKLGVIGEGEMDSKRQGSEKSVSPGSISQQKASGTKVPI